MLLIIIIKLPIILLSILKLFKINQKNGPNCGKNGEGKEPFGGNGKDPFGKGDGHENDPFNGGNGNDAFGKDEGKGNDEFCGCEGENIVQGLGAFGDDGGKGKVAFGKFDGRGNDPLGGMDGKGKEPFGGVEFVANGNKEFGATAKGGNDLFDRVEAQWYGLSGGQAGGPNVWYDGIR